MKKVLCVLLSIIIAFGSFVALTVGLSKKSKAYMVRFLGKGKV